MTARREASQPPPIAGHRFVRVLGLGGFADVFLYEQDMPRRLVAVKVLLAGAVEDELRARFQAEANVMAQLSHHPSIVTIHHADLAVDGRPYIVMEYCSGPALVDRYRRERISVAEALRIGVRLGSAVETAHRAGILHRDIKPANILTTDFGWPALTDFGIAATPGADLGAAVGMSIPWSPPELLAEQQTGDERSDVYSLASTLYSLLAGRTPFEVPGGRNGAADLVGRIERGVVPPTGRPDVPAVLLAVLARAMARDPQDRYTSAAAFARALQQVEAEIGLAVTPLDLNDVPRVSDGAALAGAPGAPGEPEGPGSLNGDDATRLRPVVSVDPSPAPPGPYAPRVTAGPPVATGRADDPVARLRAELGRRSAGPNADPTGPVGADQGVQQGSGQGLAAGSSALGTRVRTDPDAPTDGARPLPGRTARQARGGRGRLVGAVVSGVVVVGAVVAVVLGTSGGQTPDPSPTSEIAAPTLGAPATAVPPPADLVGARLGDGTTIRFTWSNPAPAQGDQYLWGVLSATGSTQLELVAEPLVEVPAADGVEVCIEVSIVRVDRSSSARPAEVCAG